MNIYTFKVQYDLQKSKEPLASILPEASVLPESKVEPMLANVVSVVQETVQDDNLYVESIVKESLSVPFADAGRNMEQYFKSNAEEHLEGRCWKEGFIRPKSSKVISYTAGLLNGTSVDYSVLYRVDVCYPYEQLEVECIVRQVNKVGICATIREKQNPMVVYITREHNAKVNMDEYKAGQKIKVRVLGHRYEPGDPFLNVMAELIERPTVLTTTQRTSS
jgi:DNA-directed RNA polymerase subunit E'/Rpb7